MHPVDQNTLQISSSRQHILLNINIYKCASRRSEYTPDIIFPSTYSPKHQYIYKYASLRSEYTPDIIFPSIYSPKYQFFKNMFIHLNPYFSQYVILYLKLKMNLLV